MKKFVVFGFVVIGAAVAVAQTAEANWLTELFSDDEEGQQSTALECTNGLDFGIIINSNRQWDSKEYRKSRKFRKLSKPDPKGIVKIKNQGGRVVYREGISKRDDTLEIEGVLFRGRIVKIEPGYKISVSLRDVDLVDDDFIGQGSVVYDGRTSTISINEDNFMAAFTCH